MLSLLATGARFKVEQSLIGKQALGMRNVHYCFHPQVVR